MTPIQHIFTTKKTLPPGSLPYWEPIQKAHNKGHGRVPNEIIEVGSRVVEAFLGRVKDPTQLAARICAQVQPDHIMVAQIVRDECHSHQDHFVNQEMITPKGFNTPICVYEVNW